MGRSESFLKFLIQQVLEEAQGFAFVTSPHVVPVPQVQGPNVRTTGLS